MTYNYGYTFLERNSSLYLYKKILSNLNKLDFKFNSKFENLDLLIHLDSLKIENLPEQIISFLEDDTKILDTNIVIQYLSNKNKTNYIYDVLDKFEIPFVKHTNLGNIDLKKQEFPFVLKEKYSSQGNGIYFIEKQDQLEKLQLYYSDEFRDKFRISPFIKTKSDYFNHYRIFTLGSGEILGSVLNYSKNKKNDLEKIISKNSKFDDENSDFYLNRKNIASNVSLGGNSIALNPNKNSKTLDNLDKKILSDIGIKNQKLPEFLSEYASFTAQVFSFYGMYILGQDWIEDKNGNFHCLEVNYMPQTNIFNTLYNKGKNDLEKGQNIGAKLITNGIKKHLNELNSLK